VPDVGDLLDGYRLDAVTGRGGMGTVYRATDLALEKTVALKVIAPHLADDDTFARRFREEAKALARLDADGIVDVYTMRETETALFFVMEHVDGPSLQTVLRNQGALEPSQALSLLRQVLEAISHAHASGVLHRDLKPSNILLDEDGEAVITDFGLAKILTSDAELTATHEQLGTVAYMSPEQIEGLRNVEETSDLFSVGLIAYEVLTGRLPFDRSKSDFVVQRAIVEESFPPPSAYAPEVPPSVEEVVLNLLAKDPTERPPDAHTARQQLPEPQAGDDVPILNPDADPAHETGLSATQWLELAVAVVLVLAGTYAGVRGTLGLPILSLSAPSPPDTVGSSSEAPPAQREQVPPDSEDGSPRSTEPPTADASPTPQEVAPSESDEIPNEGRQTADESSPTEASPSSEEAFSSEGTSETPAPGILTVRSTPDGAEVQIDDSVAGRAPLTVGNVAPGQHRVRIQLEDHRPAETTVDVPEGDTASIIQPLVPVPAVVRLRVQPSGTVQIDGTPRAADKSGGVVDSLSPGSHQIALQSDLGRWETRVRLEAGERYTRTVDFTQRVEVAVTARHADGSPLPNATVRVDGETVGYTPQSLTRRVGQHTITVEKEGYVPAERTILFEPDMDTPIVVELSPRSQ
jgi:serine/threonine protein kinase